MARRAVPASLGAVQGLTWLNPTPINPTSYVFRADLGDAGHVVVKIGDPARIALAVARIIEAYPKMSDGRFRVPQVLAHDLDRGVLVMEDARGQSAHTLFLSGPEGRDRALATAGGWIARFHKTSAHMGAFNPDPHMNWLKKQVAVHHAGDHIIPDFDDFSQVFAQLHQCCDAARGQPILRCITHRDFHLRNLLIRNLGRSYGIDFENAKRDEALRDLLFFTADAAKIIPVLPVANDLRAIARALRAAYTRPLGAKIALQAFQVAFALSGWASLNAGQTALGPNRARALAVLQMIAKTDDLFGDI